MINLGEITAMNFDGYLILSLSRDWINSFERIPEFIVTIDNKRRLSITSLQEVKDVVV